MYINKVVDIINKKNKLKVYLLICLMVTSSVLELLSIGAFAPFIYVVSSNEDIKKINIISEIFAISDESKYGLIIKLSIIFIVLMIISNTLKMYITRRTSEISFSIGANIGQDILRNIVKQDYEDFLNYKSSEIIATISNKSNEIIFHVLNPLLNMTASIIIITAASVIVLIINPTILIVIGIITSVAYYILMKIVKEKLYKNSQIISKNSNEVVKILEETIGNIRDIILMSKQNSTIKKYSAVDNALRKAQVDNQIIGHTPRYIIETVGLIAIVTYTCIALRYDENGSIIAIVGVIAMSIQRLLPHTQQIYYGWSNMKGSEKVINEISELMSLKFPIKKNIEKNNNSIEFNKKIELNNVTFRFKRSNITTLKEINLEIKKGQKIAIIGSTGSGKSTLLDLILGLVSPTEGVVCVDGVALNEENKNNWQKKISHVSQDIYLINGTILENIALLSEDEIIDKEKIIECLKIAELYDDVQNKIINIEENIGERGAKISGGQKQRIGIARALYRRSEIIVLDEATSALDNETEEKVLQNIAKSMLNNTIIHVTHKMKSIRFFDRVIKLEDGIIVENLNNN